MLMLTSDSREDINPTPNIITKKISWFEYLSLPSMNANGNTTRKNSIGKDSQPIKPNAWRNGTNNNKIKTLNLYRNIC